MYQIKWSDGRTQTVETLDEAMEVFGGQAVYCDNGDTSSVPSDREIDDAGRILVWASEEDAGQAGLGDAGQHAIAQITRD